MITNDDIDKQAREMADGFANTWRHRGGDDEDLREGVTVVLTLMISAMGKTNGKRFAHAFLDRCVKAHHLPLAVVEIKINEVTVKAPPSHELN